MVDIEFKGRSNQDFGLVVTGFDQRKRAEERVEIIEIPGRNGAIVDRMGTFKAYTRSIQFVNIRREDRAQINQWLSGRGVLRTTEDPLGFFYADTLQLSGRKYIGAYYSYIDVLFMVEPFFYLDVGQEEMSVSSGMTLLNMGDIPSEPRFTVQGTGNASLSINGVETKFKDLDGTALEIDCRAKSVMQGDKRAGRKMVGPFPYFKMGENLIEFTGLTACKVLPCWREL